MSNHDPEKKALESPPVAAAVNSSYPDVYPNYPYVYYKDTSEKQWTACLVPMLVVAQIVFFVIVMFVNNCPKNYYGGFSFVEHQHCVARFLGRFSFQPWKENPLLGPSASTLIKVGALNWWKVAHGGQPWRLLSSFWLHAGLIHLFVNLLSVIFIGIRLEQQFGFLRVGIIYVLSGLGGCILASIFLQGVSVGASAPLFGLLGAMLAELIINCSLYSNKIAAVFTLVVVGAINASLGILPGTGNFVSIGGFTTGFFLGFVLLIRTRHSWSKRKPYQHFLRLVSVLLLIAWFTVGLAMLFKGKNGSKHCSWCHYVNCVPISKWHCDA